MARKSSFFGYGYMLLAAAILYVVFSFTSRMAAPSTTYIVTDGWKYQPRGFWSGRPVAPHAGYPGPQGPPPGPADAPQGPPHGPPAPGPLLEPMSR